MAWFGRVPVWIDKLDETNRWARKIYQDNPAA